MKLTSLFLLSFIIADCEKAVDSALPPKGQITGKVVLWDTDIPPPQPATVTVLKRNMMQEFDSLMTVQSGVAGAFAFTELDTGEYFVRSNVDNFYKTGFAEFAHLTPESLSIFLVIPIDTVKR